MPTPSPSPLHIASPIATVPQAFSLTPSILTPVTVAPTEQPPSMLVSPVKSPRSNAITQDIENRIVDATRMLDEYTLKLATKDEQDRYVVKTRYCNVVYRDRIGGSVAAW
jgi:hypothetical protein